ncbi:MAG: GyrI-like domain-containing protein [Bacteroidia bacterium]
MNPPKIITLPKTKLVGMSLEMSRANDKTAQLWQGFMQRRIEIKGAQLNSYYSVNIYPRGYNQATFLPTNEFSKWAAAKVEGDAQIPKGMDQLTIPDGKYAVFQHKGPMPKFIENIMYIFNQWLPNSEYELDDRPHFELLPANYPGPMDPNAEEEIWIPIA